MDSVAPQNGQQLNQLKRQWTAVVLIWLLFFATVSWLLRDVSNPLLPFISIIFCLTFLWNGLRANHREGGSQLLPTFGLGNHLTLLRGLAISFVAGFIFLPRPVGWLAWLPMLLYTFADIADYFDGYLARVTNHTTKLGSKLDIEFDGLGMLIVTVLGIWYGMLPLWYLLLGIARPWFILGLWWRERQGKPIYEMVPSIHRRIFAGFQMGFMSAVLWPIIPPGMTYIAGTIFGLATGLGFIRDWLTVNGRLDPTNPTFQKWWRQIGLLCQKWLPLGLRFILPATMLMIYLPLSNKLAPPAWASLMTTWGMSGTTFWAGTLGIIGITGAVLVTAGVMGRLWSFLLVFPIGFDMATTGLTLWNGTAIAAVIYLVLLGMGPLALWQPEEKFINRRLGGAD
jgi:CDP-diacylglycerol--glycerol-3-phosphate 3-phosphatidyltransferase